jgi:hypothetical protein
MADDQRAGVVRAGKAEAGKAGHRLLGSLRDALKAASRVELLAEAPTDKPGGGGVAGAKTVPAVVPAQAGVIALPGPVGGDASREARVAVPVTDVGDATTRIVRGAAPLPSAAKTKLVRGKVDVERGTFHQDPVVGWLVVVGGPGLGAFRPIFEGNNTVGRGRSNRIAIDFGDESISADEQAYLRYDSSDRSFLFVPNLSKTNVVSINDRRPTGAVRLAAMDVITMGRTQLAFVPFCGEEFDWSELVEER